MRNSIFIIAFLMLYHTAISQVHGGVEQYSYGSHKGISAIVPRAFYQNEKNWYGEIRYNYEDFETFSINAGKTFSKENRVSYSITPLAGLMAGKSKGGLIGLNVELGYEKIFFTAESEYAFMANNKQGNFFYNWSELGYEITGNVYAGMALQLTHLIKTANQWEPGIMAGFSFDKFTFPMYVFNPASNNRYFVVGLNIQWNGLIVKAVK